MLDGLDSPYSLKMDVFTNCLTKPPYGYKQASTSFFVNHSPQILTISVFIILILFEVILCDHRYLNAIFFAFLVVPDYSKLVTLGYFAIRAKAVGSKGLISSS